MEEENQTGKEEEEQEVSGEREGGREGEERFQNLEQVGCSKGQPILTGMHQVLKVFGFADLRPRHDG